MMKLPDFQTFDEIEHYIEEKIGQRLGKSLKNEAGKNENAKSEIK